MLHAQLLAEEPSAVRQVTAPVIPTVDPSVALEFVKLEIRRLEKQELVDWGASPEARFVMTEFVPILGKPLLSEFKGLGDKDSNYLSQIMQLLTALISGIESKDTAAIHTIIADIETLTFKIIKCFVRLNPELITLLFDFLLKVHSGGPEKIDLSEFVAQDECVMQEAAEVAEHWRQGGRLATIATPAIDACVLAFRQQIRENADEEMMHLVTPVEPEATASRRDSFLQRMFK